jgi:hypothetical protein
VIRDGARYYVRGKVKSTTAIWSGWSTWDWFETVSAITMTIPSGASETLTPSPLVAGADSTATTDVQVFTNDRNGYRLSITGPSDSWGMDGPGLSDIPQWTGTPDTPTNWPSGTSGYFGFTVLAASTPGGKDTARWGTGSTDTSFATLNYTGLPATTSTEVHRRSTYSLATDTISTAYRVNVPPGQTSGAYAALVTYTATANP